MAGFLKKKLKKASPIAMLGLCKMMSENLNKNPRFYKICVESQALQILKALKFSESQSSRRPSNRLLCLEDLCIVLNTLRIR